MNILTFEPFGYEGSLVTVETDTRRGIPAVDMVGLSDGAVKEERERIKAAVRNSGFDFPMERVLVSLSPTDLKKEGAILDLAIAASIITAGGKEKYADERVLVLGELEHSGAVRPVRAVHAALCAAKSAGVRYAIVPKQNILEAREIHGMRVCGVENLCEAINALKDRSFFKDSATEEKDDGTVSFRGDKETAEIDGTELPKKLVRAIEIAVAGKHSLMVIGKPGCGKTLAIQRLVPLLAPNLTWEEAQCVTRIYSIAALLRPSEGLKRIPPFRMPHQTCSLEGMCGGGANCRPGEVSLSHNGFLFLDEAAEFKSSVLQMLRVPLESGCVSVSRAGRTTVYPARFQVMMAVNPCPCGNYGSREKICLCSEKTVRQYWRKLSSPLIDRIGVICALGDNEETVRVNLADWRSHIRKAFEIQRRFGNYNNHLSPQELLFRFKSDKESEEILDSYAQEKQISQRRATSIRKLALTIANMDGRENVTAADVRKAVSYSEEFHSEI